MSTTFNAMNEFQQGSPLALRPIRSLYWALRRELWEFRSIYVAPLIVAALVLLSFLVSMAHMARQMRDVAVLSPEQAGEFIQRPYAYAAMFLMGISFIVAIFYCLEALHAERRDRSILFWKSLPLSDLDTVLAKISIPIIVIPLIVVLLTVVTNVIMLLVNSAVLMGSGYGLDVLREHLPLGQMWMMMTYHMFVLHGLWFAPVYGWLLLVSSWSRRLAFLWAALPLIIIEVAEKIVFKSSHFLNWLRYRWGSAPASGAYPGNNSAIHEWMHLHLSQVLLSPGLWTGLAFAGICIFAAARLRRRHGPI